MALTLYLDRPTPLHRRHPAVKLVAMLSLFFAAFLTDRPQALLPLVIAVALLLIVSGAWVNVRRLRALFAMVFVMSFVVWTIFFPGTGQTKWSVGPLVLSDAALEFALGMAMKLTTFLGIGVAFLSITTIEEFAYALVRLGVPYRFGFTLTLAFRLVPVFVDSAMTVIQAQRSRGFDFEHGNLLERGRRYVPVIVPVFIGALRRADGMAMALEARGFQRRAPRSSYARYRWQAGDSLGLALSVLLAGGYLALWKAGLASVAMVPF